MRKHGNNQCPPHKVERSFINLFLKNNARKNNCKYEIIIYLLKEEELLAILNGQGACFKIRCLMRFTIYKTQRLQRDFLVL